MTALDYNPSPTDAVKRIKLLVESVDQAVRSLMFVTEQAVPTPPPSNKKKLTRREVDNIRDLKRTAGYTNREIASIYDLNPATVSRIVRGLYWK